MKNENGFVLIGALVILLVLVMIGISATSSSILEMQIAGADRIHTETFYQADSGVYLAARLLEENIAVREFGGFSKLDGNNLLQDPNALTDATSPLPNNTIVIDNINLWQNLGVGGSGEPPEPNPTPATLVSDIRYFLNGFNALAAANQQQTVITIAGGNATLLPGSDASESQTIYTIRSLHIGRAQSEAQIEVRWRHINNDKLNLPARL
jgi:Tfp pilus assembly protein PilX